MNNPKTKMVNSNGAAKVKSHAKKQPWPMSHKRLGSGWNQLNCEEKAACLRAWAI